LYGLKGDGGGGFSRLVIGVLFKVAREDVVGVLDTLTGALRLPFFRLDNGRGGELGIGRSARFLGGFRRVEGVIFWLNASRVLVFGLGRLFAGSSSRGDSFARRFKLRVRGMSNLISY
jgi:hypothetical protein